MILELKVFVFLSFLLDFILLVLIIYFFSINFCVMLYDIKVSICYSFFIFLGRFLLFFCNKGKVVVWVFN